MVEDLKLYLGKEGQEEKTLKEKKLTRNKKVWIFSGAGAGIVAIVGVLIFTLFGPKGATPEPTPTPTEPTATATATPTTTTTTSTEPYGTIIMASPNLDNPSFDPKYSINIRMYTVYDMLISVNETGSYIGQVAESWSIGEDGVSWTFYIRRDIKFHNGDPLTAEDVKFSTDRFGDTTQSTNVFSLYLSESYNKVSSAVVDDYTFRYVTDHPEPALMVSFAQVRILPKSYFESIDQDYFRAHPVGSGPWKFVELETEATLKMEANTEYWGQVPAFQYVEEFQVPEEATRIAMLENGMIDIALGLSPENIAKLQQDGWNTVSIGTPTLANINFQGTWLESAGPTHDIRVRQAMSYALNRQEICDTFYYGNAEPGGFFYMHPGCWGWDDSLLPDSYDLSLAKSLLSQAGYPSAFDDPIIHIYTSDVNAQALMQLCQTYWTAAGIQTKLEIVEVDTAFNYIFDLDGTRMTDNDPNVGWIFLWISQSTPNSIYHAANMYCSWGAHNCGNDPVADSLYNKVTTELDSVKAKQHWTDFQKYAEAMYIDIGICMAPSLIVVSDNLGDFTGKNWISLYDACNGIQHKN